MSNIDKSSEKNKELDEIYFFHLDKTYKQYKKYKKNFFKNLGLQLTSDQWIVLKRISEKHGITQRELADSIYKEPASVTRMLDILEKEDYIIRRHSATDRRIYELYLTTHGKKTVEVVLDAAIEKRALGMKGFTQEEMDQLIDMLERLYQNFSID